MTDIKLFRIQNGKAAIIPASLSALEKKLQNLIEINLDKLLSVRFIASEYSTGKEHGGRIDTLGIDENNCPVIIEYKRTSNENVINQGLYYLDWLLTHKKDFEWLVMEKLGKDIAESLEWEMPRLLCIAGDFTKYDEHAIKQINRNIELIRYKFFGEELLLLELVNVVDMVIPVKNDYINDLDNSIQKADNELLELYNELQEQILSLGDDIQLKTLKHYYAFRRMHNFACVVFRKKHLMLTLNKGFREIKFEPGFSRDVTSVGHLGTGDVEVTIKSSEDIYKAMDLIKISYENS